MFSAAPLTPTLTPRSWIVQGALGGLGMALGYLIGRTAISLWRLLKLPEPSGRALLILRLMITLPVMIVLLLCLLRARAWQNDIRLRMEMSPLENTHTIQMLLLAIAVFAVLFLIGTALQWLFDCVRFRLYRYMPARAANVARFVLTALLVLIATRDGVLDRIVAGLDASYTAAQALFDTAPPAPDGIATGGAESRVDL